MFGPKLPKSFVLDVHLTGVLRENPSSGMGVLGKGRLSVYELARGLREAATDDRVKGVLVRITSMQTGWAAAMEMRRSIDVVRKAGKPVTALIEAGGDKEYLVATAADSVFMVPGGHLFLDGLAAEVGFWKETLDKIGLEFEVERVGAYKSGPESYTRSGMSPQQRETLDLLLDDIFGSLITGISERRGLSEDSVRVIIDLGPYGSGEALAMNVVDGLKYREEAFLAMDLQQEEIVDFHHYFSALPKESGHDVALVVVEGTILPGGSSDLPFAEPTAGSETVTKAIREAREGDYEGVLIRVNSPGGSSMASDLMWDEVRKTALVKPVVVSMGDLAASGGYYIAMPADRIVAEPTTITGSIGVYAGKFVADRFFDKIGFRVETLTRGRHADQFSINRPFTAEEKERLRSQLFDFYWNVFLAKAAEGRDMSIESVDSLGRGRVWSGVGAARHGLVDALGGIWEAKNELRRLLGLPKEEAIALDILPKPKPLILRLYAALLSGNMSTRDALSVLAPAAAILKDERISLSMPFGIEVN